MSLDSKKMMKIQELALLSGIYFFSKDRIKNS